MPAELATQSLLSAFINPQFNNTYMKYPAIIAVSILIRIILIHWLSQHQTSEHIVLTDIDYKVYSEAGEHILSGTSPYNRHTYRYTPLLATAMTVNQWGFHLGKYIFVVFDLLSLLTINSIFTNSKVPLVCYGLNPILVYLTMRGSCESIGCFLMFLLVWLDKKDRVFLAGVVYGVWVHFRVYPVVFSVAFLLYFSRKEIKRAAIFVAGSVIGFLPLVAYYYSLYGQQFLQETYLYHLTRVDNRHNLSAYWYWTYLAMGQPSNPMHQLLKLLPTAYLLIKITTSYYKNLHLSIFLMTYVFVLFNKVLTVQYYMWIFASLALIVNSLTLVIMSKWRALLHLFATWILGVLVWVWCAQKIEGQGEDMFGFMWVVCIARLIGETWILMSLIATIEPNMLRRQAQRPAISGLKPE